MNELAAQVSLYFIIAIQSVAAGILFTSFSATRQRWKVLACAALIILFRLVLMFSFANSNYITNMLALLSVFGASFLFHISMPMRVFLTCCFWSAKEICIFMALGPQSAVDSIVMGIITRGMDNQSLVAPESIQQLLDINAVVRECAFSVTHTVFLLLILRYIIKSFTYKSYKLRRTELLFLHIPCLSGIAVTQMLRKVLVLSGEAALAVLGNAALTMFLFPVSGAILLLGMAATVKLFQNLIRLHMEETDKRILEKQMTQIREQVQDVQAVYTDIRGIRHDMANHLANIRLLIQTGTDNRKELDSYIGKLEDTLDTLRFDYQTKNPITDVILHQKILEARNKGIAFESEFLFPEALDIDSVDIAVILSNALDNATEACAAISEDTGKRYVKLSSYKNGVMFFIEVENSFNGNLVVDNNNGLPVSGKADGGAHGIGLANMKRCAEKYFGDINITHSNNVFHLTVMLQGRG